jgi:hypothetical protein
MLSCQTQCQILIKFVKLYYTNTKRLIVTIVWSTWFTHLYETILRSVIPSKTKLKFKIKISVKFVFLNVRQELRISTVNNNSKIFYQKENVGLSPQSIGTPRTFLLRNTSGLARRPPCWKIRRVMGTACTTCFTRWRRSFVSYTEVDIPLSRLFVHRSAIRVSDV